MGGLFIMTERSTFCFVPTIYLKQDKGGFIISLLTGAHTVDYIREKRVHIFTNGNCRDNL